MRSKTALLFALPLSLVLGSCSLFGTPNVTNQSQATRLLYVSESSKNAVLAVDVESKTPYGEPITGLQGPGNMAVHGDYLYVVNQSGDSVSEINRKTQQITRSFGTGNDPWGIAITDDGQYLYVTNYGDGTVSRIHVGSGSTKVISVSQTAASVPVNLHPRGVVTYHLNNKYYAYVVNETPVTASTSTTGYVAVIQGDTYAGSVSIPGAQGMRNITLATDGSNKLLYLSDSAKAAIYRLDIAAATPETPTVGTDVQPEGGSVTDLVAAPAATTNKGYFFATYANSTSGNGGLTIRQNSSGTQIFPAQIKGGTNPTSLDISSDGNSLFIGAGSCVFWMDVTTPSSPREALLMQVAYDQEYQNQAVTDVVAAPGVPNQR